MKCIFKYKLKYIHRHILFAIVALILFGPTQLLVYSVRSEITPASIIGSALLPIWFLIAMYKRIVGVVISAILIDENSVTQVKNEGITIEWNDIRKIRLIPYNIFYCDSYLAIYGSKAINGNKQSIIRIGRKRENYENAWIAIADFVMENKPDIILPERFVKEIEEMKKSNNTPV